MEVQSRGCLAQRLVGNDKKHLSVYILDLREDLASGVEQFLPRHASGARLLHQVQFRQGYGWTVIIDERRPSLVVAQHIGMSHVHDKLIAAKIDMQLRLAGPSNHVVIVFGTSFENGALQ